MSGPGYRKRILRLLSKSPRGITHRITMHSRGGTAAGAGRVRALGCKDVKYYSLN